MKSNLKALLLILGGMSAALLVAQLVMGILIAGGNGELRKAHQHSGYLTVTVTLVYVALSLATVVSSGKSRD